MNRRRMLRLTGGVVLAGLARPDLLHAAESVSTATPAGLVCGEPRAAAIGNEVLAAGGNAVDAVVAAAFAAAITSPSSCGFGGYGGHATLALRKGREVVSIDFNSTAPAAARPDMYPLDARGKLVDQSNTYGWLAAGVPGTVAGLCLALQRYGSKPLRAILAPAIRLAKEGFPLTSAQADGLRRSAAVFKKDPGSARLYLRDGEPYEAGEILRNPQLGELLETLAARNSVDSFYRGDIAQRMADAFQKNGGLVTAADLAAYQAREVQPLKLTWGAFTVYTAPLTAGGLSALQALAALQSLDWGALAPGTGRAQARLEALRIAWHDRLRLLGDPAQVEAPVTRLLSADYAAETAGRVRAAVKAQKPVFLASAPREDGGTIHLSGADGEGNLVALTLTHGNGYGARVTVEGLGLTLGHGMSRFDPTPGHPNCPGPGKRPLNNMCPSVVLREGQPVLALGGAGGRAIPNAMVDVLLNYVALGASLEQALAAPRLSTQGAMDLSLEKTWPPEEVAFFKQLGYQVKQEAPAKVSAVAFSPATGASAGVWR